MLDGAGSPDATVIDILTVACADVIERGLYPSVSACDKTYERSWAVERKDSFSAKLAVNALKCVL